MEWTGLNDIREKYLSFFESKSHTRMASAPLVPKDDNSLLLINSGMAPLKKFFMGLETPPNTKVTTCQKCIRTPDIENVGKTARHGTFFEMLGNFSFGDYFKHEATRWAWEFATEVMKLPKDKIWITVYEQDDDAIDVWVKEVGIDPSRIVKMGKEDNFWEIGSGPCGPCSELYFDRGEENGCGSPECKVGCDCDRYVEFWNLVFTQFVSDGNGHYEPMAHPNIDTGMGLERLACIMQGVDNLFEVDTIQNILKHVGRMAGVEYKKDDKVDVSLRVITDHARSTVFMISDGITPQNEGRGYVLRRLLRRAARHGRLIGINEPFLYKIADTVINESGGAYPELHENAEYIKKIIKVEEERFAKTIDQGMELLSSYIDELEEKKQTVLSGADAFKLYDTFGFPIDLTIEILEEKGMSVNQDEFKAQMEEQRKRARAARANNEIISWEEDLLADIARGQEFTGYTTCEQEAKIAAIVCGGKRVDELVDGEAAEIILDRTSFYAESGGQVGDSGVIKLPTGLFRVMDCKKSPSGQFLHIGEMEEGVLAVGDSVKAIVDEDRRKAITRNHSACHLLQEALRRVLGDHVHQAGSYVDENRCRFDFSHFSAVTPEELAKVERIANELILDALDVNIKNMPISEAKGMGATALFGEKYGDVVRVVNMGEQSVELCGGVHVSNTAKIGSFKILAEASVAAGIRRIEAATGFEVLNIMNSNIETIGEIVKALKANNADDVADKARSVVADNKETQKKLDELNAKMASIRIENLFSGAKDICGVKLIVASFDGVEPNTLRTMGDQMKANNANVVGVITSVMDEKASIMVVCGKDAVAAGAHSGKLVKEICALCGGSGGGRPDSAMGGASEIFKIDEAVAKVPEILKEMVK